MTGNGKYQTCTNNKTNVCTRLDCEGSYTEDELPLSQVLKIDYCFGLRLNSCFEPLSMDFYLKIPSHNYSKQFRIIEDDLVDIGLALPMLKAIHVTPLLDFELERDGQGNALVSVTLKVRSSLGLFFDEYEEKVVDEQKFPLESCTPVNSTSNQPDKDFMSIPCHALKYPSLQPKLPTHTAKPSETLNKTCNFLKRCSKGETCEMTSAIEGRCDCEPDYHYIADRNMCVSVGSVGSQCLSKADCGVYEECQKAQSSGEYSCQCEDSYHWDDTRQLCILDQNLTPPSKGDHHIHPNNKNDSSDHKPHSTQAPPREKHRSSSLNSKYLIMGGSVAGVVILLVVVVVALFVCRHRRKNRFTTAGGGLYDSRNPMLADTDDDVDLVM